MYKCALCTHELQKLTRGPFEAEHFYALPALEVDDQGSYYRSQERSLYLTAWMCPNCKNVQFFAAKATGEIQEGRIRYSK